MGKVVRTDVITDQEFHRRRAETEMERALKARQPDEALRHLELARLHRQVRERVASAARAHAPSNRPAICRTDKES